MMFSPKVFASTGALVLGLAGMAYAAGDHPMGGQHSQMDQQTGQQAGQGETIVGEVQKKEGEMYTITTEQGEQIRLHIEESALQGNEVKEGDRIQARILEGTEEYHVLSAQKAGEDTSRPSQQQVGQSQSGQQTQQDQQGQQEGQFTKTISGEIKKVEGNVYYVQDPSGKEIRLRLDQSAQKSGEFQEGDKIEALVTQEKEFHVISAEPAQ